MTTNTLKGRLTRIEMERRSTAGTICVFSNSDEHHPQSQAFINGDRVDREADESEAAFLDRLRCKSPHAPIIHVRGALME